MLAILNQNEIERTQSSYKDDVWSLAIMFLEMSTLQNLSDLYRDGTFQYPVLLSYLAQTQHPQLNYLLTQMTIPDGQKRPDFLQLQGQIQGLDKFVIISEVQIVQPTLQPKAPLKTNVTTPNSRASSRGQSQQLNVSIQPMTKPLQESNRKLQKCQSTNKIYNIQKKIQQIKDLYFTEQKNQNHRRNSSSSSNSTLKQLQALNDKMTNDVAQFDEFQTPFYQDSMGRTYVCETYLDGSIYEGYKLNNYRDGQGSFYYSDGSFYIGQWQQDKMSGHGSLYYPSGKIAYKGCWLNDRFQGKGIVYNEQPVDAETFNYLDFDSVGAQWVSYEGEFVEDQKEGYGILLLTNGERFEGQFSGDLIHGKGALYGKNKIIEGIWHLNKKI